MKTLIPSEREIVRQWHVVDAADQVLGRVASAAALVLMGKHKPTYTTFLDTGDHVIVINAEKVVLTGKKETDKIYRSHSQYPGGLKERAARFVRAEKPERIIEEAVWGMLPKNKLGRQMLKKLNVYRGTKHPHEAQKPERLEVAE
jgi:large subunit ribosomal protein L13